MKNKQYSTFKLIGGICAIGGGILGISIGLEGEISYLMLGTISLLSGTFLFYGLFKK